MKGYYFIRTKETFKDVNKAYLKLVQTCMIKPHEKNRFEVGYYIPQPQFKNWVPKWVIRWVTKK